MSGASRGLLSHWADFDDSIEILNKAGGIGHPLAAEGGPPSFPACRLRVSAAAPAAKTPGLGIQSGFSLEPYDRLDDRIMTGKPPQAGFRPEPGGAILERLADGDSGAMTELVEKYGDLIWSLARRYFGTSPIAQESVQEAFLSLWSSAGRFRPGRGSELTFVLTVARRRMVDQIRREARFSNSVPLMGDEVDQALDGQVRLEAELASIRVRPLLDMLSDNEREILSLSLYEGYSHSEIAERLNMPIGTVKTRIRRSLIRMRAALNIEREESRRGSD